MSWNNSTCSVKIVDDIVVSVPVSLQLMTSFVLHEQKDWFEDEIKFLRTCIKPGMNVVDIGANYGLYSLTIAKLIGSGGKVWSFEPTTTTCNCLKQSVADNSLDNIEVIQSGLSDQIRKAKFYIGPNSELNSLSKECVSGDQYETVLLLTLDHCAKKYGWNAIDFIKIDAEGEEGNILKKGKNFLSSQSPLIMFELKHGDSVNISLINRFKSLGYESYRLVPGLNVLVPFRAAEPFDGYLLNLFCCKHDRAASLEAEGVIASSGERIVCPADNKVIRDYFFHLPLWNYLGEEAFDENRISKDYFEVLCLYILSHSKSASAAEKVGYLLTALECLRKMLEKGESNIARLVSFARISFDAGERALGVDILSYVINKYDDNLDFEINEPLFPASSKYDSIQPGNKIKEWLFASVLEQYIIKHAFSSYFTGRESLPQLERLRRLGFMDEDMKRRCEMITSCFPSVVSG